MQGKWKVKACVKGEQTTESDGLEWNVIVTKDQFECGYLRQINGELNKSTNQPYTIKIDDVQNPKRITLTGPQQNGVIPFLVGIYRLNGDKMLLLMGMDGRIPQEFNDEAELTSIKIELERAMP